jgi:hypothetical protein
MKRSSKAYTKTCFVLAVLLLSAGPLSSNMHGALGVAVTKPSVWSHAAAFRAGPADQVFLLPAETTPKGSQPFAVLLCKFADASDEPAPASHFEGLMSGDDGSLDAYWREVSYGRINLGGSRVAGWYPISSPASAYSNAAQGVDLFRLAADCTAAADSDIYFPDYVGINLAFNRGFSGGPKGGQVCLELDGEARCYGVTFLWPDLFEDRSALAHEMGHAFGLRHSVIADAKGYANPWDLMAEGGWCWPDPDCLPVPQHMTAYQKDQLGFIAADRKYLAPADSDTTIVLERLAQPGTDGYLMAQIPIAGSTDHFYTVEARQRVGRDARLPTDAVVIHEVYAAESTPARLVSQPTQSSSFIAGSVWTVGRRFVDAEHGIKIAVDEETATGFVATLSINSHP